MKKRAILKKQLTEAWTTCVNEDYPKGVINSERALQACLYHRLSNIFEMEDATNRRQIFIEPTIYTQGHTWRRMPDMVICDTKNIIAIVELKFHPRTTLSGKLGTRIRNGSIKDLDTLITIAKNLSAISTEPNVAARIQLNNDRYLGIGGARKTYGFANNLILVWAGIYKKSNGGDAPSTEQLDRVLDDAGITVQGGFLQLHARTQENDCLLESDYSGW